MKSTLKFFYGHCLLSFPLDDWSVFRKCIVILKPILFFQEKLQYVNFHRFLKWENLWYWLGYSIFYTMTVHITYKIPLLTMGVLLVHEGKQHLVAILEFIKLRSPKCTFCELLRKNKLISKLVLHSINSKWTNEHLSTKFPSSVNLWRKGPLIQLSPSSPTPATYTCTCIHISVVTEEQMKMLWRSPHRISDALQPHLCGIEVWKKWEEVRAVASMP